jgi:hypothetical protein
MKLNFKISIALLATALLLLSLSIYFDKRLHVREDRWPLDVAPQSVGWWSAGPTIRGMVGAGYRFSIGDEMMLIFPKLFYPIFDMILFKISIYTITVRPYGYDSFPYKEVVNTVRFFMDHSPYSVVFNETEYDGYLVEFYVKYNGSEWKNRVTDFRVRLIYHADQDKYLSTILLWSSTPFFATSAISFVLLQRSRPIKRNKVSHLPRI